NCGDVRVVRPHSGLAIGRVDARRHAHRNRYDLPLRAAAVALVVAVVTTASHWIGSFSSAVFARFSIVMASFVVIMHPRAGGKAAAAVLSHAQPALVGLALGFLGVHSLAERIGVWWSLAIGLAITMAWSAALWVVRRLRLRIARLWAPTFFSVDDLSSP